MSNVPKGLIRSLKHAERVYAREWVNMSRLMNVKLLYTQGVVPVAYKNEYEAFNMAGIRLECTRKLLFYAKQRNRK